MDKKEKRKEEKEEGTFIQLSTGAIGIKASKSGTNAVTWRGGMRIIKLPFNQNTHYYNTGLQRNGKSRDSETEKDKGERPWIARIT